jgi:phosphoribosylcarboxyaminoimidazole (NCAIR) mutase
VSVAVQTREREKEQQFAMFGLFANTGTQAAMSVTNGTAGFTVNCVGAITHIGGMTTPVQLGGGVTGSVQMPGAVGITASTNALVAAIDALTATTAVLGSMLDRIQENASSKAAARSDSTGAEGTILTPRDRAAFIQVLEASEPTADLRDIMTLVP